MKKMSFLILGLIFSIMIIGCATSRYYHLEKKEFADFDYGFEVKNVLVKNISVAYIDEGSSDKVLVLIHGLGSNAKGWIKNISGLSKTYRVIALDLPGYGKSQKGYFDFSLHFYAQILKGMLDNLKINKATIVGHSMGGQIAMITALEYPDIVSSLVLLSPAGLEKFSEGESAWFKKVVTPDLIKDTPIRQIDVNLRSNFYETPADAEFMITERIQMRKAKEFDLYCYAVAQNVAAMVDEPVHDKLDKITQPALVIFGENDQLIPNPYLHGGFTKDVAEIGKEIPNSTVQVIPECGHFVQFEKTDKVNKAIVEFVN